MQKNNFMTIQDTLPPEGKGTLSHTPPKSRQSSRAKLRTIGDVSYELAKLYREARNGKIDVASASRLANMLSILSRILSDSELEKRIEVLEQRQ